ncbi:Protein lin-54 [Trichinella murrelli]|uniref:Protein lin-54 n=1 Tax=Trichinella murrelli TaxID=144512 RepID=A0A0V0TJF6_9BILA|nr:Protein lin-54 [Trichinella murrelli]
MNEENPDKVSENPEKIVDNSDKINENPEIIVEDPAKIVENPEKIVENPEKIVENPDKITENPPAVSDCEVRSLLSRAPDNLPFLSGNEQSPSGSGIVSTLSPIRNIILRKGQIVRASSSNSSTIFIPPKSNSLSLLNVSQSATKFSTSAVQLPKILGNKITVLKSPGKSLLSSDLTGHSLNVVNVKGAITSTEISASPSVTRPPLPDEAPVQTQSPHKVRLSLSSAGSRIIPHVSPSAKSTRLMVLKGTGSSAAISPTTVNKNSPAANSPVVAKLLLKSDKPDELGQKRKLPSEARMILPQSVRGVCMVSGGQSVTIPGLLVLLFFSSFHLSLQSKYLVAINSPSTTKSPAASSVSPAVVSEGSSETKAAFPATESTPEAPVLKRRQVINNRRPCNCTKSQCLKLYCDCFANGEFCSNCHCTNCLNNLTNELDRSRAIKSCLERNPMAFQPKIGKGRADTERLHNKGCNCKKSSCLKNYCECYEARVSCTVRCKCVGCRNTEADRNHRNRGHLQSLVSTNATPSSNSCSNQICEYPNDSLSSGSEETDEKSDNKRLPGFLLSEEVIEAVTKCLIADTVELSRKVPRDSECIQMTLVSEFGRCLDRIIDVLLSQHSAVYEDCKIFLMMTD